MEIIKRENYRPNYTASVLATGKSKIIVIIVPDSVSPFFAQFASNAAKILKKSGYSTILIQTDNDEAEEKNFFLSPVVYVADGLISVTDSLDNDNLIQLISPLKEKQKPVLFVDRDIPTYLADCFVHETKKAVDDVMERLLQAGHRRIGIILGSSGQSIVTDKAEGYRQALQRWNIPIDEELIRFGSWTIETGIVETQALMNLSEPVTAIIAGNNRICEGAIHELSALGKTIGKDFSLVGFEESDSDRRLFELAGISTLQLNPSAMAADACDLMLSLLSHETNENREYSVKKYEVSFVDRGSITKM